MFSPKPIDTCKPVLPNKPIVLLEVSFYSFCVGNYITLSSETVFLKFNINVSVLAKACDVSFFPLSGNTQLLSVPPRNHREPDQPPNPHSPSRVLHPSRRSDSCFIYAVTLLK